MSTTMIVLLCLFVPLAALGAVVVVRVLYTVAKALPVNLHPRRVRGPGGPIVPILEEPSACPTCGLLSSVQIRRADFQGLPQVEHFICGACHTEFLGPKQEELVEKRIAARAKLLGSLTATPKAVKPKIALVKKNPDTKV